MEVTLQYELPQIPPSQGALVNVGGNTIVSSGNLQSPNYSPDGSSGYVMKPNGDAVFNNLTATGRLTVTAGGVIGGFDIGTDYIRDTADTFGLASEVTGSDDVRFWSGSTYANRATAPLRLTEAGFFYGSNVDVTGTVTSNAGAIAGWTLSTTELSSSNNKIKLQSTNERILVGSATAPLTGIGVFIGKDGSDYEFRVGDPTGKYIHFDGTTGFTMNGMYISQAVLASIAAGSAIEIQNWQFSGTFSATSATQVNWTAGTLTLADGTTYAISAGNTGTMAAFTYIYFSYTASTTVLQTTTTASSAVGVGRILICVARNGTNEATFQAYGGSGGINLNGSNIVPGSIGITESDIALQNWTTNIAFSVAVTTTPTQVNWGAGSIYVNSTTYSISAGNTGTMTARTYIYLNPAVSTTVLQTTPTLATAIGNGKLLIATATASATTVATFNVLGGIGGFRGGSSSIPTAANGWSFSGGFAASASNVVYWDAGNFRTSDGNVFSITGSTTTAACTAAGLPSPMAGRLYIYFDLLAPSTFKVGQYIADALGDGKIYVGTCAPGTTEASFLLFSGSGSINIDGANIAARSITANEITASTITANEIAAVTITAAKIVAGTITSTQIAANTIVAGNIAAGTITTTEIAANTIVAGDIAAGTITTTQIAAGTILASNISANTITTNQIAANTITASNMNVSTLSAISANMGTITAGTITFTAAGHLKGGQSAYNSGTGFFLGYESGAYKFSIGSSTADRLTWDQGTGTVTIIGNLSMNSAYTAASAITAGDVCEQATAASEIQRQTLDDTSLSTLYDLSDFGILAATPIAATCQLDAYNFITVFTTTTVNNIAATMFRLNHDTRTFKPGPIYPSTITDSASPYYIYGVVRISSDKVLVCYDATGTIYARVITVASDGQLTFSSATNVGIDSANDNGKLIRMADNKVCLSVCRSGDFKLMAIVMTVSGTTITLGTAVDLGTGGTFGDMVLYDTDKILVSHTDTVTPFSVSGTTITAGTLASTGTNTRGRLAKISTTKCLLSYNSDTSSSVAATLRARVINLASNVATAATSYEIEGTDYEPYSEFSIYAGGNRALTLYIKDSPADKNIYGKYINIDGSDVITAGSIIIVDYQDTTPYNWYVQDVVFAYDSGFDFLLLADNTKLTSGFFRASKKSIGVAPATVAAAATLNLINKGSITGLSGYTVGQQIRDKFNNNVIAVAKTTTSINVI